MRVVPLFAALFALIGCGTVTHGRYQKIPVASSPAGAAVSVRCGTPLQVSVVTPAMISVPRRASPCEITLDRDGYQERVIRLERQTSRAFWMNLTWIPGLALAGYGSGEDSCDPGSFVCTTREEAVTGGLILGIIPAGIGMAVDAMTGAMYQRVPRAIEVTLEPR